MAVWSENEAHRTAYREKAWAAGVVTGEAVDDGFFSVTELQDAGWGFDWNAFVWRPDPNHKFLLATRAVARGAE